MLEDRPELSWPADLYLEGSDQHRGWFQSSLLEACGTRGRAPYKTVLTHGFLLDEKGYKMSKSLGNVVSAESVWNREGADILRLWAVSSNYAEDVAIGPEILKQTGELYRRLRNTLRYLLGALDGFSEAERVPQSEMPPLERWLLHRLWEVDRDRRVASEGYEFTGLINRLHHFAALDLSAFYFDISKDSLYCDRVDSPRRRAVRTVLNEVFNHLIVWLAPVLCFTAEEAWAAAGHEDSIHLQTFPEVPAAWRDDSLAAVWTRCATFAAWSPGRSNWQGRRSALGHRCRQRRSCTWKTKATGSWWTSSGGRPCWPISPSPRVFPYAAADPKAGHSPCRTCRGYRWSSPTPKAINASAAGECCRKSAATRIT